MMGGIESPLELGIGSVASVKIQLPLAFLTHGLADEFFQGETAVLFVPVAEDLVK